MVPFPHEGISEMEHIGSKDGCYRQTTVVHGHVKSRFRRIRQKWGLLNQLLFENLSSNLIHCIRNRYYVPFESYLNCCPLVRLWSHMVHPLEHVPTQANPILAQSQGRSRARALSVRSGWWDSSSRHSSNEIFFFLISLV